MSRVQPSPSKRAVKVTPSQQEGKAARVRTKQPFVGYPEFKRIVQSLGVRSEKDLKRRRAELAPLGVPSDPRKVYRDEWEGATAVFNARVPFVDYDEFKRIMEVRGVRTQKEFERRRAELAPLGIPGSPEYTYRSEWEGFNIALGGDPRLGRGRHRKRATLDETKAYARASGMSSEKEWLLAVKERRIPPQYPSDPRVYYKNDGWKGWADFWGRETFVAGSTPERALRGGLAIGWVLCRRRTISVPGRASAWRLDVVLPEERIVIEYDGYYWHRHRVDRDVAKTRSLNTAGWRVVRVRESPLTMLDPSLDLSVPKGIDGVTLVRLVSDHLARVLGVPDPMATKEDSLVRAQQATVFTSPDERILPMDEAMAVAQSRGIRSAEAYRQLYGAGSLPPGMPSSPHTTYAATWKSWGHFLGTGTVASWYVEFRPFESAREAVHKLRLPNGAAWRKARKTDKLPPGVPTNPNIVYRNQGWNGIADWLGYTPLRRRAVDLLPFGKGRVVARGLGLSNEEEYRALSRAKRLPPGLPARPAWAYRDQGWSGFRDWLGLPPRESQRKSGGSALAASV